MARVMLHDEIERVLAKNRGSMNARSIAAEIVAAGRYLPLRASTISQQQVHARIRKHPDRFVSEKGSISLLADQVRPPSRALPLPIVQAYDDRARWDWEGNVQATLARHLTASGWTIESAADTATRERGIDLLVSKGERRLAI